jgi:flagellar motor switch protein FliG
MAQKHLQYELLSGTEKAAILMMALQPVRWPRSRASR